MLFLKANKIERRTLASTINTSLQSMAILAETGKLATITNTLLVNNS